MINILVTITVSEQNRPQTLRLLEQLTEASQQENGNISYQHYLHPTDPEQLLIVELWQNGEVLAAHEATRRCFLRSKNSRTASTSASSTRSRSWNSQGASRPTRAQARFKTALDTI